MNNPSEAPPPAAPPAQRPLVERPGALAALLVAAIAIVFLPSLFGDFLWDDVPLIRSNAYVRDLSRIGEALTHDFWHVPARLEAGGGFLRRYYRPVVTLAYALQFKLFGESPPGFHAVSLALHAACSLLVFGLVRRRLGDTTRAILPALLGAALFALHPSRPESVSWISGSTDLWMTLWVLLALRAWDRGSAPRDLGRAALFLSLAVLSKETAIVAPALLAVDLTLLPRAPDERRTRWRALGLMALAVAATMGLRALVLPGLVPPNTRELPSMMPARVLSSLGHYVAAVAWPWRPSVDTALQRSDLRGLPLYDRWSVALGAAFALALAALAARAWRDPRWRPWLADALWFVVALAPTVNIIPMGMKTLVALRFLYLPMVGLAALTGRSLDAASGTRARPYALGFALAALVAFGRVTSDHAAHFASAEDLWTYEARIHPCNQHALAEVAAIEFRQGRLARVPATLQRAHRCAVANGVGDDVVTTMVQTAQFLLWTTPDQDQDTLTAVRGFFDAMVDARSGTARLETRQVHMTLALQPGEFRMRRALKLEASRAYAHLRTGRFDDAERMLRALTQRDPYAFTGRRYLAMTLAAQGRLDASLALLDGLARNSPTAAEARALGERVAAARAALAAAGSDPVAATLAHARLFIDLGLNERARALVRSLVTSEPGRYEPLEIMILADIEDLRFDAARGLLGETRARFPRESLRWDALAQRIPPAGP